MDDDKDNDYEQGSTTNDSEIDGGERNALSDYDDGSADDSVGDHGRQMEDEWDGVLDDSQVGKGDEDSNSCPSEYPITQQPKALFEGGAEAKAGFRIHVDDEVDETAY
jgi:hypothetical protein